MFRIVLPELLGGRFSATEIVDNGEWRIVELRRMYIPFFIAIPNKNV